MLGTATNWESVAASNRWKALLVAVMFQASLLMLPLSVWKPITKQEPMLRIELGKPFWEPEALIEKKEPEPHTETIEKTQTTAQEDVPPREDKAEVKPLSLEPAKESAPSAQIKTSINDESFVRWLANDTQKHIMNNPKSVESFANTFISKQAVKPADIIYDQGALGGGIYKVRRNGKTCNALVMIPMSFDDHLNGTITTSGECREDNPIKLELNRLSD